MSNSSAARVVGKLYKEVEIAGRKYMISQPKIIMLDEPFVGIDPITVGDLKTMISALKERGIGILITDHNVRETLGICDRAYIINAGSVMAEGKPEEIIYNEGVRKVYLGENFKL